MSMPRITATLKAFCLTVTVAACVTSGTGCAALGRACNALFIHVEEKHDLAEIRSDTRQELADQREEARRQAAEHEVQQARYEAQRAAWEQEFCQANQESQHEALRRKIKETVESKVAFDVEQGLEVGELEVDVEALQKLLKERENEPATRPEEPAKRRCACCDNACGCGSGHVRRHCPHCRHKRCELDCGGPEALARLEDEPLKRPLRPAEIPMRLPVRLTFGFQQPEVESARIKKQPNEPFRKGCDPRDLPCTNGIPSCTDAAGAQENRQAQRNPPPVYQAPVQPAVPPVDTNAPPTPVPDPEARHVPRQAADAIRLGMAPFTTNDFAWGPHVYPGTSPMSNFIR